LIQVARWADTWNISALWVGDPTGGAPNSDDSYATTTVAALSAVTETLRLGVFLTLRGSASVERIADDVGVLDQMSGGRLELGLVVPDRGVDEWTRAAAALLRSWNGWPVPGTNDTVPVTPQPVQPMIPRVVVGEDAVAERLRAGRVLRGADSSNDIDPIDGRVPRRQVVLLEPELPEGVIGWLSDDPAGRLRELRSLAGDAGANEVALVLPSHQTLTEEDTKVLGTLLVPCLRAYAAHADMIVGQAWSWLTDKRHLHDAPV
jgi:hypothetical protein